MFNSFISLQSAEGREIIMPWSALPPHIDNPSEWGGTDWDTRYQRWMLKFKGIFAFGPRATEWWAKWRELPIVLFCFKVGGAWRWEASDGSFELQSNGEQPSTSTYLSTIQYWSRAHIAVQWPLHLTFHVYWNEKDVPKPFERPRKDCSIRHMIFFRFGARRDADRVYWFPAIFFGGNWN
jgi:hypothetical protein